MCTGWHGEVNTVICQLCAVYLSCRFKKCHVIMVVWKFSICVSHIYTI